MAEHQPDEHYAEFLNITLKQAFDEWKILTIDVDNIQSNSLKTYLWLNALVTTGLFSLIAYADLSLASMSGLMPIYGAGLAIAALASIASFIKASRMLQGTSSKAVTRFYKYTWPTTRAPTKPSRTGFGNSTESSPTNGARALKSRRIFTNSITKPVLQHC